MGNTYIKKEPFTDDYIIGSDKNTSAELRKYFKEALGEDCEKYAVIADVLKNVFYYKGRSLKEITDECHNPSWYDNMDESAASFRVQKETKPKFENVVPCYLDGDALKTALGFSAYLTANGMQLKWDAWNTWKVFNKNKTLCWVKINMFVRPITWAVSPCLANIDEYEDIIINEELQNFIWDSFKRCRPNCRGSCRGKDTGGITVTILGKKIYGVCNEIYYVNNKKVDFVNPDETAVERIKMLLGLEKQARIK